MLAKRDFACVVGAYLTAGAPVEDARVIGGYAGARVGEGLKSVAVNVQMRAGDHTIRAEEVLAMRPGVIAAAESQLGAVWG